MSTHPIQLDFAPGLWLVTLTLNDPDRRNAMSLAMFDALDEALNTIARDHATSVVLIRAQGPAFCAGFDLSAAVAEPALLGTCVLRLSTVLRTLRRLPQVVTAAVHGPAIAGGCALLSACDFVWAAPSATMGYPVHGIGLSPAVTLPTLMQAIGPGAARALVTSGRIISAADAHRLGLVTHLAKTDLSLNEEVAAFTAAMAVKPPHALRVTKRWLNELDGSLDDSRFDRAARDSAAACGSAETQRMLSAFWASRHASR